ncbi:glycosyltransferase family 4 protein [Desulfonatronovibrio magnus]|uniref:glycosyltransferase family 4 protein n=1 Tax=Desulfonatronovibrio magnus TaxID=698827 RepID=UPI0005EAED9D|nr:glycosyltransferase family 4 protein [Desulfonatronovibrio magnus]
MSTKNHKKKSVLIIVENLPLPFDRRVWQECLSLRQAGYQVCAICPKGRGYEKSYEELSGIHIYRHPIVLEGKGITGYLLEYSSALFWEFILAARIWKKHGFEVIQACNPPDLIFLIAIIYKYLLGKKFIFDHHDINPELYLAKFGRKDLLYRLMILLEKMTFSAADYSIATNESYKKIAIERGGMDGDRVFVVRSGPSLERFKPVPPNPAWKNGREYMVGYVGVMGCQEGLDHLLEAVGIVIQQKKRTDIQFVLVGGGTELEKLKMLCADMGFNDYVTFTGRVPDHVLAEVLCTADVCVNPDIANEMNDKSTMNKIMEYMALGKPIVQYDLTEGRRTALDASLYARPNDIVDFAAKITSLLSNPELRKRMGNFGINRVREELHWGIESVKYLEVYKLVLQVEKSDSIYKHHTLVDQG